MRNTGIEYLSADRKPVVLEELATLLPPLGEEQRSACQRTRVFSQRKPGFFYKIG